MKILVTGAKGFVGRNLCANLKNIKNGYDHTRPSLKIDEIYEYDLDSTPEQLDAWCKETDFVFNLAGVNRPKDQSEFMKGNFGFASTLLDTLKKHHNTCPIMLSSSQQASLTGRFGDSEYGRSKKAGEELFFDYSKETGAKVLVYRFPNLFGKWCRPNYNSAVATFCNNIANDLPIKVNDPNVELELLYIDDLVNEMMDALEGKEHHCIFNGLEVIPVEESLVFSRESSDATPSLVFSRESSDATQSSSAAQSLAFSRESSETNDQRLTTKDSILSTNGHIYCYCPVTHKATLGEIVDLLNTFARNESSVVSRQSFETEDKSQNTEKRILNTQDQRFKTNDQRPTTPVIPEIPNGSFAKKLYSTYLSYMPKEKVAIPLKMNVDARGSFTELLKTKKCGQVSVNISKPGITKGEHWHNTKWEFFIVVSGHALIQERKIGTDEVLEFEVSGDKIEAVQMLPGVR